MDPFPPIGRVGAWSKLMCQKSGYCRLHIQVSPPICEVVMGDGKWQSSFFLWQTQLLQIKTIIIWDVLPHFLDAATSSEDATCPVPGELSYRHNSHASIKNTGSHAMEISEYGASDEVEYR